MSILCGIAAGGVTVLVIIGWTLEVRLSEIRDELRGPASGSDLIVKGITK